MITIRDVIEQRQDDILEKYYKLHQDSDSGIQWYEDRDIDFSYNEAIADIEREIEEELGIMSLVILENGKFLMQRIHKLNKFSKKGVAAIIQNDTFVYTNGYFRFDITN